MDGKRKQQKAYYSECPLVLLACACVLSAAYDEILITEGSMVSVQCDVHFGYRLSTCCRIEENHAKP